MGKLPSYDRRINDLGWDIYGAASSPHGSKEKPDYHAAVLRAPDLTGMYGSFILSTKCRNCVN